MKSLEIVNEKIEDCKSIINGLLNIERELDVFEKISIEENKLEIKSLETIKADLEVLDILRKNLYIEYDTRLYVKHSFNDEHKDFNKVKQWLEGINNGY